MDNEENKDKNKEVQTGTKDNANEEQTTKQVEDKKAEITFTQEKVNQMLKEENSKGMNAVLKSLGFSSQEEAAKSMGEFKKFMDSKKTDEQLAQEKNSKIIQEKQDAIQKANIAEAKVSALSLGVKPNNLDDVVTLAMSNVSDGKDFKTAMAEIKTKYPSMFSSAEDSLEENKGKKGTGGNVKNSKVSSKDVKGIGSRLAAKRKEGQKKSSFFGNK